MPRQGHPPRHPRAPRGTPGSPAPASWPAAAAAAAAEQLDGHRAAPAGPQLRRSLGVGARPVGAALWPVTQSPHGRCQARPGRCRTDGAHPRDSCGAGIPAVPKQRWVERGVGMGRRAQAWDTGMSTGNKHGLGHGPPAWVWATEDGTGMDTGHQNGHGPPGVAQATGHGGVGMDHHHGRGRGSQAWHGHSTGHRQGNAWGGWGSAAAPLGVRGILELSTHPPPPSPHQGMGGSHGKTWLWHGPDGAQGWVWCGTVPSQGSAPRLCPTATRPICAAEIRSCRGGGGWGGVRGQGCGD